MKPDDIEFRVITERDETSLTPWTSMLSEESWGPSFPVEPFDEVSKAVYVVLAYHGEICVGGACMNMGLNLSPDQKDLGALWFSSLVVTGKFDEKYRRMRIASTLHAMCITYARTSSWEGDIVAATENVLMIPFFLNRGWTADRLTIIEDGSPSLVFRRTASDLDMRIE